MNPERVISASPQRRFSKILSKPRKTFAKSEVESNASLGNGVTVAQQTLTLFVLVRIQVPQPVSWRSVKSLFSKDSHWRGIPRTPTPPLTPAPNAFFSALSAITGHANKDSVGRDCGKDSPSSRSPKRWHM